MSIYFRLKFGNSKSNCLRLLVVGVEIWALCSESEMAGVVGEGLLPRYHLQLYEAQS